jgi:hypothetical protein
MMQVAIVVTDAARAARAISSIEALRALEGGGLERVHQVSASADAHLQALDDGDDDLVIFADDVIVMVDWKGALDELIDQAQLDLGCAPLVALSARDAPVKLDPDLPYARIGKPVVALDVHGLFIPAEHRKAIATAIVMATFGEAFGDVVRRYVNEEEDAELVVTMPEIILVMTTT